MKKFTEEAKNEVVAKLLKMKVNMLTYEKYEAEIKSLGSNEKTHETLEKIAYLRKHKANEVYTIFRKYGYLSEEDLGIDNYNIMIKAILEGDLVILAQILPYIKYAYLVNKISDDNYQRIIDRFNSLNSMQNETKRTLK